MNQSTQVVSIITPDSHSIIKQAGVTKKSNLNAVRPYPIRYMYRGVNEVFTAEVTGQNG